jgi:selenocysteine lyase/cysteine desulfurase
VTDVHARTCDGFHRDDVPGAADRIHLNNAGASMMPRQVVEAVVEYQRLEAAIGGYEAAAEEADAVKRLYPAIAQIVNAREDQVVFADSGTRAWNAILYGIPLAPGEVVLTTQAEFGSNVVSLIHHCQRSNAVLRVVRCTADGALDLDDLHTKAEGPLKLVAATHVAAHRGYVAPVDELSAVAREAGAFFLLDACQSVGHVPVDVSALGCHALTGTSRKWLRGPRGAAFSILADDLPFDVRPAEVDLASADSMGSAEAPLALQIRSDARRFELWERSYAAALGLGCAADYLLGIGLERALEYVARNGTYLREGLGAVADRARILADPGGTSAIVGVVPNQDRSAGEVKAELVNEGINVSTMADYDAPWDYAALGVTDVLRLAPHYFANRGDIDRAVAVLEHVLA